MTHRDAETLVDLGAIWDVFWAGRRLICLMVLIGVMASLYLGFVKSERKYRATAVLVLETQIHKINGIQSIVSDLPLGGFSTDPILFTELEVFKSRFLIRDVVHDLGLMDLPEFSASDSRLGRVGGFAPWQKTIPHAVDPAEQKRREIEATIDIVLDQVEVALVPNSFAFHITATSSSPRMAQDLANSVAKIYVRTQLDTKKKATQQATKWLSQRVAELKQDLELAETRVKLFDSSSDLLTEADLQAKEIQLKEMRARVRVIETRRAELEFAQSRGLVSPSSDPVELVKPLASDPKAISLVQDDATVEIDHAMAADIRRANAQISTLNRAIQKAANQINTQAADLLELEQIEREAEASRTLYEFFLSRLKETTIQQGIQRADSRILSPAVLPLAPASPDRPTILVIGAVLGMLAGTILVFLRDGLRRSFKSVGELANAVDIGVIGAVEYAAHTSPQSATVGMLNAMRGIRTTLLGNGDGQPPKSVMLVSSHVSEGSGQLAAVLAKVTGQMNTPVLLLNADMGEVDHPTCDGATFDEVMNDPQKFDRAILSDPSAAFDVMSFAADQGALADIFASAQFASVMERLKRRYGLVVVRAPAAMDCPDARILSKYCDAILYCVRADYTDKRQVLQGIESFQAVGASVTGLVLTRCLDRKPVFARLRRPERVPHVMAGAV